jgi:hypothetical protein
MDQEKTLVDLINPKFVFKFGDKEYQVKKANIEQVVQYQLRVEDLNKDTTKLSSVKELEIMVYCVYLLLRVDDPTVTEDYVRNNLPGGLDGLTLLTTLGFIDPARLQLVQKLKEKLISNESLQTLLNEPAGHPEKSQS